MDLKIRKSVTCDLDARPSYASLHEISPASIVALSQHSRLVGAAVRHRATLESVLRRHRFYLPVTSAVELGAPCADQRRLPCPPLCVQLVAMPVPPLVRLVDSDLPHARGRPGPPRRCFDLCCGPLPTLPFGEHHRRACSSASAVTASPALRRTLQRQRRQRNGCHQSMVLPLPASPGQRTRLQRRRLGQQHVFQVAGSRRRLWFGLLLHADFGGFCTLLPPLT